VCGRVRTLHARTSRDETTKGDPVDYKAAYLNISASRDDADEGALKRRAAKQLRTQTEERPLVLIVEDEEPIASVLAMIVEDAGYRQLTAMHGKEALGLALAQHPALVLTDLMMPYLDGAELIVALHKALDDTKQKTPPIVLMTAAGILQAQSAGADALLRKPFNVDEVEALLQRYLG
jgi:CheY-like chemotaxis protein